MFVRFDIEGLDYRQQKAVRRALKNQARLIAELAGVEVEMRSDVAFHSRLTLAHPDGTTEDVTAAEQVRRNEARVEAAREARRRRAS